eukprot:Hpha_TRINITY_DN6749_c0_g1::TRINITY_DN6749_c0_g1_i1::g.111044::m.111044
MPGRVRNVGWPVVKPSAPPPMVASLPAGSRWCESCGASGGRVASVDLWGGLGGKPHGPLVLTGKMPFRRLAAELDKEGKHPPLLHPHNLGMPKMSSGAAYRGKKWNLVAEKDFALATSLQGAG